MNPRIKPVKLKIIAAIFIDAFLFLLLLFVGYAFFFIPARAEHVDSPPATSTPSQIFALKQGVDGTTLLEINNPEGKVFVCKYVGTPGVDERLQTGDNPISVSIDAIPDYHGIGSWFADAQVRSYVLVEDVGQPKPPITDCPQVGTPTPTTPPIDTPTLPPPSTAPTTPTTTTKPSATSTLEPSPTSTLEPSASPTLKPTNTQTSTIQPSRTPSPTIAPPPDTDTPVPSPTYKLYTPTPKATSSFEVITCPACYIVNDLRELIVSGLYTANLLNTEDISSTFNVSITLYNEYKGVVVGKAIGMVDTQPANEVMQVETPLWCNTPITGNVYWIHTVASAQASTGQIWFVTDEWVRINLSDDKMK
jgi:hypothetical protein